MAESIAAAFAIMSFVAFWLLVGLILFKFVLTKENISEDLGLSTLFFLILCGISTCSHHQVTKAEVPPPPPPPVTAMSEAERLSRVYRKLAEDTQTRQAHDRLLEEGSMVVQKYLNLYKEKNLNNKEEE